MLMLVPESIIQIDACGIIVTRPGVTIEILLTGSTLVAIGTLTGEGCAIL